MEIQIRLTTAAIATTAKKIVEWGTLITTLLSNSDSSFGGDPKSRKTSNKVGLKIKLGLLRSL